MKTKSTSLRMREKKITLQAAQKEKNQEEMERKMLEETMKILEETYRDKKGKE